MTIGFEKVKKITMSYVELHEAASQYIKKVTGRTVDPNLIDRVEQDSDGSLYAVYLEKEPD